MTKGPVPLNTANAPPFGTLVTYRGVEAVFTANTPPVNGCASCAYDEYCGSARGQTYIECPGGVYVGKLKYLELKLLGEIP